MRNVIVIVIAIVNVVFPTAVSLGAAVAVVATAASVGGARE